MFVNVGTEMKSLKSHTVLDLLFKQNKTKLKNHHFYILHNLLNTKIMTMISESQNHYHIYLNSNDLFIEIKYVI